MAKKISAAIAARLKALKIEAKTEEEAREKLLKILAENDIDGMEEEDTDSLLDMAESMVDTDDPTDAVDDDEEEDDDTAPTTEEAENDALAKEVAGESAADDDDEEEDDEPEEAPKPAPKKSATKKEAKPAAKKEAKQPEAAAKKPGKRGVKIDPRNNDEDKELFKFLEKFFPKDKYEYSWVATNGVTIKYKGSNSNRAVITVEACTKLENGKIKCNCYLLTFTKSLDVLDEADLQYQICWNGAPFLKGVTFDEVEEAIAALLPNMEEFVGKIDKRLGDNRKKMEDSLSKTTKKEKATKAKAAEPAPEVPADDDDEVDDTAEATDEEPEVEEAKPAKKPAAKKSAGKKAKK